MYKKILKFCLLFMLVFTLIGCDTENKEPSGDPVEPEKLGDKTLEELEAERNQAFIDAFDKTEEVIKESNGSSYTSSVSLFFSSTNTQEQFTSYQLDMDLVGKQELFKVLEEEEKLSFTGALSLEIDIKLLITVNTMGLENSTVIKMKYGVYLEDNTLYIYQGPNALLKTPAAYYKVDVSQSSFDELIQTLKGYISDQTPTPPDDSPKVTKEVSMEIAKAFVFLLETIAKDPSVKIEDNQGIYEYTVIDENLKNAIKSVFNDNIIPILNENELISEENIEKFQTELDKALDNLLINNFVMKLIVDENFIMEELSLDSDIDLKVKYEDTDNVYNIKLAINLVKQDFTAVEIIIPDHEYQEMTWQNIIDKIKEEASKLKKPENDIK